MDKPQEKPDTWWALILPRAKKATGEWTRLKQFRATRQAILKGEWLWMMSPLQRESRGYMPPLNFNIYQSSLASAPSLALNALIWFVELTSNVPHADSLPSPSPLKTVVILKIFTELIRWIGIAWLPLAVGQLGWGAAYFSLRRPDRNKLYLENARDAFFYVDGAVGLFPQAGVVLAYAIALAVVGDPQIHDALLAQPLWLGLAAAVTWATVATISAMRQLEMQLNLMPIVLAGTNGYYVPLPPDDASHRREHAAAAESIPVGYWHWMIWGAALVYIATVVIVSAIVLGVAWCLASLRVR